MPYPPLPSFRMGRKSLAVRTRPRRIFDGHGEDVWDVCGDRKEYGEEEHGEPALIGDSGVGEKASRNCRRTGSSDWGLTGL